VAGPGAGTAWLGRRGGARVSPDPTRRCDRSAAGRIVMRGSSVIDRGWVLRLCRVKLKDKMAIIFLSHTGGDQIINLYHAESLTGMKLVVRIGR